MSLQIWLPLNGTLENKGCCNAEIENHGATVDTEGKIGSCYSFDGSDDYISIDSEKLCEIISGGTQSFSIAMWVKQTDSTRAILFGTYGMSGASSNNFFNLELSTSHTCRFDWKANPDWTSTEMDIGSDTWSHICYTYDGTIIRAYLNGNLKATRSQTLSAITYTGEYRLGRDNRTGTTVLNGQLNDFRIYDHCLSQAEVSKIAKGLVLHYKLDGFNGGARQNLLRTTPQRYGPSTYLGYTFDLIENLVEGQTYTIQFWDVDVSHSGKSEEDLGIWVYWGGGYVCLGRWKGTEYFTNGHADYLSKTFTVTASDVSGRGAENAFLCIYNSPPNDVSGIFFMSIGKWKLEKGSNPTGYVESNLDSGIDTALIVDSSGYGHHGTIANTVTESEDSPRYACSINLPNGNSCINCGRGGMVTDSITVNMWVNFSSWANPVSCTESGGWNFESNPVRFPVNITSVGYKHATAAEHPSANAWHMLTGVYDRINQKMQIYIDGELSGETDTGSSNPIHYHSTNVIWIGAEATGSATTYGSPGMIGKVSDFRIYCTPLSAEAIKELYQTAMKIDNHGNVMPFELAEGNSTKVSSQGIVTNPEFVENGNVAKISQTFMKANEFIER